MWSEHALDIGAAMLLCLAMGAWARLQHIRRITPDNWVGSYDEFMIRTRGEEKWSSIAWISLLAAMLICIIDVFVF